MQVQIAGFNIDKSLIDKLDTELATPEVISAAYARISRSSKDVTELRTEAMEELAKARASNDRIIFEMGHSSIAEHAVFNIDIIGISRVLAELIQSVRLASFTEKSQRYVTLDEDFVIPKELDDPKLDWFKKRYIAYSKQLFAEYQKTYDKLLVYYKKKFPKLNQRELEGKAKEDARYILPMSTKTQMGITINARSLENLLRKLYHSPLLEAKELYDLLFTEVSKISPSLIRYTESTGLKPKLRSINKSLPIWKEQLDVDKPLKVVSFTPDPDELILAALLTEELYYGIEDIKELIYDMSWDEQDKLWRDVFEGIQSWHKMPRAFELCVFCFEIIMSESCWAQFKRHRIGTIIKEDEVYEPSHFYQEAIRKVKRTEIWETQIEKVHYFRDQLSFHNEEAARYIRMNTDTVKILAQFNLREIYHFVRLRSDDHAQAEIRNISDLMRTYVRVFAPFASRYLCGKSEFCIND
ncbi:MAG: thymidylate synthase (FAD) [Candidatus Cloacimonetes bacterium HGW-Cloacimonetes-2]|jgi:flavin-dependent thymidylate synthase|nr:MAG: thymidylate synthase (FAD) [Candidatus Cloacimonetes bacterium HGW-Cloacimonetes-2]